MTSRSLPFAALLFFLGASAAQAADCPATAVSPANTPPGATVGTPYSQAFSATNTSANSFAYSLTSGLPASTGLSINAASGVLSGTPLLAGSYLFTVTATDPSGCSGGRVYPLSIAQGSQTLSFTTTAPAGAKALGPDYQVGVSTTSSLPPAVSIAAAASGVCTITGSAGNVRTVALQGAGTCVIDATQAGDANWLPATPIQQSFAVAKADQSISFTSTAPVAAQVGGAAYTVTATATSSLAVSFSIDPSAAGICAISGSAVTFQAVGNCVINANQAGNALYAAAPQVQQAFGVGKSPQTISFTSTAPAAASVGGTTYTVAATASSGLAVSFSIDASASGVCTIAGSSVSFIGAGTCVVDANQAGNATWSPAPQVQQSFAVGKGAQTISFTSTAPAAASVGGTTYTVTATASSGLAVSFSSGAAAVCSVAGSTVSFLGAGTCVINANQAGNANYNAAPQAQQSFAVTKAAQTISFTTAAPVGAAVSGPGYSVAATASSGLTVALSIDASASGVCTIAGNTVSFVHAGTCVIDANQAGNAAYSAATQVQQSFTVAKGVQSISFTSTAPGAAVNQGPTYTVSATASSGLPVSFSIDASAATVCSIAGATVSFIGGGTCVIDADQAGDADWVPASQTQQSFSVARADQTISFTSTAPVGASTGGSYTVAATASSGLPVSFSIDASASAVCSVAGDVVSFLAAGNCVIDADQAGDTGWNAAPQVQQSVAVTACITPALGQVINGVMPGASSLCINNTSGSAMEFTYLPINTSTTGDITVDVVGTNIQAVTGPPTPRPLGSSGGLAPLADPPQAVDAHGAGEVSAFPDRAIPRTALMQRPATLPAGPLTVGQLIDLNANVSGACSGTPDVRKARVEAITTPTHAGQQVLYAVQEVVETNAGDGDWHPPVPGGYQTVDFQNIIDAVVQAPPGSTPNGSGTGSALLKTGALDVLTTNFGDLIDIDSNGGVVIFFTPAVNALSPPASSQVTMGNFLSRDIFSNDPVTGCSMSNQGEILYMLVPDPTGVVNSNVRTFSFALGNAPVTILHHLQHLNNAVRRAYVNGASAFEERWLDEALSYQMQELVFFNMTGLPPRSNIVVTNLTTGPNASARVAAFNTYENLMFGAARTYFMQLSAGNNGNKRFGPLRTTQYSTGSFPVNHEVLAPNFSTTFLFLRYALDRKATGDAALLNALANATSEGRANLQNVLGGDLNDWARDFLVAMYTDDAVSGVAPQYIAPSWNYRSLYTALYGSYQLTVDPLTNTVTSTYLLGTGGGTRYTRFGIAAGTVATIDTTQTGSGGAAPPATVTAALVRTK